MKAITGEIQGARVGWGDNAVVISPSMPLTKMASQRTYA